MSERMLSVSGRTVSAGVIANERADDGNCAIACPIPSIHTKSIPTHFLHPDRVPIRLSGKCTKPGPCARVGRW